MRVRRRTWLVAAGAMLVVGVCVAMWGLAGGWHRGGEGAGADGGGGEAKRRGSWGPGSFEPSPQMRQFLSARQGPVEFYGLVLDQDDQPVGDVEVEYTVFDWEGEVYERTEVVRSDAQGRFALSGFSAKAISFGDTRKRGYRRPGHKASDWHVDFGARQKQKPDPSKPLVFRMWRETEPPQGLAVMGTGHRRLVVPTGQAYTLDLRGSEWRLGDNPNADLRIRVKRSPQPRGRCNESGFDWRVELEAVNGAGLAPTDTDLLSLAAPAEGYVQRRVWEFRADEHENWQGVVEDRLYVRLHDGGTYGRLSVRIRLMTSNEHLTEVDLHGDYGVEGSRYLWAGPVAGGGNGPFRTEEEARRWVARRDRQIKEAAERGEPWNSERPPLPVRAPVPIPSPKTAASVPPADRRVQIEDPLIIRFVDEANRPLKGVKVHVLKEERPPEKSSGIGMLQPWELRREQFAEAESDAAGIARVEGLKGRCPYIAPPVLEGYEADFFIEREDWFPREWIVFFRSDPPVKDNTDHRAIRQVKLRMFRLSDKRVPLVYTVERRRMSFRSKDQDRSDDGFWLLEPRPRVVPYGESMKTVDLRIQTVQFSGSDAPGTLRAECTLSCPDGDIQPAQGPFPFSPPKDGYGPSASCKVMAPEPGKRDDHFFHVRVRGGKMYGLVRIRGDQIGAGHRTILVQSWINPTGEPNLTPDRQRMHPSLTEWEKAVGTTIDAKRPPAAGAVR